MSNEGQQIRVHQLSPFPEAEFRVQVGDKVSGTTHTVILEEDFWRDLTAGTEEPAELIARSFDFLLARESASEILSSFNLREISNYFPEYEEEIAPQES